MEIQERVFPDLFLACACYRNIPGALASFRQRYFPVIGQAVRSFDESPAFAEEVYQRLLETLFVGNPPATTARIVRYSNTIRVSPEWLAAFVASSPRGKPA
jgi:hypothetical protein